MKESTIYLIMMYSTEALAIFFVILALMQHDLRMKLDLILLTLMSFVTSIYFHLLFFIQKKFFE